MSEFTDGEKEELCKILDEIEQKIKEKRSQSTVPWVLELLDDIEKIIQMKK